MNTNFKSFLVNDSSINLNNDSEITVAEAQATTELIMNGIGIADLTGIPVVHSAMKDHTAYGVFRLLRSKNDNDVYEKNQIFNPKQNKTVMENKLTDWHKALESMV